MKDKTIEMLTKKVNNMKKNDVKKDKEVTGVIEAIRYQNALLLSKMEQAEEMEIILSKENKSLQEKVDDMTETLAIVENEKQQKDSLLDKYKREAKEHKEILNQFKEVTNRQKVMEHQIKTCLEEKSIMKDELDTVRLEIHALRQYKEQVMRYKMKEHERGYKKMGTRPWNETWRK